MEYKGLTKRQVRDIENLLTAYRIKLHNEINDYYQKSLKLHSVKNAEELDIINQYIKAKESILDSIKDTILNIGLSPTITFKKNK